MTKQKTKTKHKQLIIHILIIIPPLQNVCFCSCIFYGILMFLQGGYTQLFMTFSLPLYHAPVFSFLTNTLYLDIYRTKCFSWCYSNVPSPQSTVWVYNIVKNALKHSGINTDSLSLPHSTTQTKPLFGFFWRGERIHK